MGLSGFPSVVKLLCAEASQNRSVCQAGRPPTLSTEPTSTAPPCRNHKATIIQSWVRMWLTRLRFRRTTDAGRKAALRAAAVARRVDAAVVLQKYCRRWLACMQVGYWVQAASACKSLASGLHPDSAFSGQSVAAYYVGSCNSDCGGRC